MPNTRRSAGFRHEAVLYRGEPGFLQALVPFLRDALDAREPVLVAISRLKIDLLRRELGPEAAAGVSFADIEGIGRNPARLLQFWRDWADAQPRGTRRFRGVSELVWPGRTPMEITECELHESLLNTAFRGGPSWWLVCPYDSAHLGRDVIDRTARTHLLVNDRGRYRTVLRTPVGQPVDPLPRPKRGAQQIAISLNTLPVVRAKVREAGARSGLSTARSQDLAVAVNEAAANSIRHGGGTGTLRIWRERRSLVCEVSDDGWIADPFVGRIRPLPDARGGAGVWLINQTCDLVQIRSEPDAGSVIRMRMWLDAPAARRHRSTQS